jgi:hypothetical protein
MRKVLFKIFIPPKQVEPKQGWGKLTEPGTGCFEPEFTHEGLFHQWAASYEEFENGAGNYTVALIEIPSGNILEVLPTNIKFIEP